jgi:hypothetical protein
LSNWKQRLRRIWDDADAVDWEAHLRDLNARYGLSGRHSLAVAAPGMPPVWWNGDLDRLEPGRWVLVVSLNPSLARAGRYDRYATPEQWRELWRTHLTEHWRPSFFRPRVRLAAAALGETVAREDESAFANGRMLFTELCPYASERFVLDARTVARLVAEDRGFRTAAEVTRILLDEAAPALVLVNGKRAVEDFEVLHRDRLRWERRRYLSVDDPGKTLWHLEGTIRTPGGTVPVAGFPFLRSMAAHNSDAEVAQLGEQLRALVTRHTSTGAAS